MRTLRTSLRLAAVAAVAALGLTACGGGNSSSASSALPTDIKTVKIGVADGAEPYWQTFKTQVKKEVGVDVEFVNFSDYNQPNKALNDGELDMNEFQHLQYLANSNVKQKQDLQPIVATAVYPLPLYSDKYSKVADIPQGGKIAIPNDPVNSARALGVLEQAGLIKLKKPFSTTTTLADLDKANSKVTVVAVDAKQTAQQLGSVAGAVINNNYATAAKIGDDKIIAKDDPNSEVAKPYINVFVVRNADKDNETLKKVADVYHEADVEKAITKDLGTNGVFKTNSAKDLQDTTAKIEEDIKNAN